MWRSKEKWNKLTNRVFWLEDAVTRLSVNTNLLIPSDTIGAVYTPSDTILVKDVVNLILDKMGMKVSKIYQIPTVITLEERDPEKKDA